MEISWDEFAQVVLYYFQEDKPSSICLAILFTWHWKIQIATTMLPKNSRWVITLATFITKLFVLVKPIICVILIHSQSSFAAGVVPIVTGPKNYPPFIPTPHSVIFLDDFRDPRDLAKHLRFLLERPEEYKKYIDFRFNPQLISEEFRKNWDGPNGWNHNVGLRRLCDSAWMFRTGKKLTSDNPEEDWMKPRVIEADSSCNETFDKYAYVKELSD